VTVAFLAVGSATAGAALGATLGWLGGLVASGAGGELRLVILAALLVCGLVLDLAPGPLALPTVRRQVDERWLNRYRGWVYGLGFGIQLGAGVITIVSVSAVYVAFAACVFVAGPVAGLAIGAAFGLARAAPLVAAAPVTDSAALFRLGERIRRLAPHAHRLALGAEGALAVLAICAAVALS
jgi:hypothetical protein